MTATTTQTMPDLLRRLKRAGYDEEFLRRVVLPDWWEDSLAEDPGTRWQIELRIAQRLSLSVADLADPRKPLNISNTHGIRLKRAKTGTGREEVAPGMVAARNAVSLLLPHLQGVPPLPAKLTAAGFRRWILARRRLVDLAGLAEACWRHGIAVFHFAPLPTAAKRFAGMAYFEDNRPVIVLASGYDAPPRLAFYLAHEAGHVLRGHVKPGGDVLVDSDLDGVTEDRQEREADGDALEILSGERNPSFCQQSGLTAVKLMAAARRYEEDHGVHAGATALIYGKTAQRMAVAAGALKLMNMDAGGRAILAEALRRRLSAGGEGVNALADLPGAATEVLPLFGVECRG